MLILTYLFDNTTGVLLFSIGRLGGVEFGFTYSVSVAAAELSLFKPSFTWMALRSWVIVAENSLDALAKLSVQKDKDVTVEISSVFGNLGAFFDESILCSIMSTDSSGHVSNSYIDLKCIQRSLPTSTAILLVLSFVISQVDYCNGILAGLPKDQLDRIQSILSVAARLIFSSGCHDHVTFLMRDRLHWLRVPQSIEFKCYLLV